MSENALKKARVIATGEIIEVYLHYSGKYVQWPDCKKTYETNELTFL